MKTTTLALIRRFLICLILGVVTAGSNLTAQEGMEMPKPGPELDIFKHDLGEWDCEIKAWDAPGAEAKITKGSETNRMLGGFWLLSDFKGQMMGMDFEGHGTYGYDPVKKKYVGSWMDSLSPTVMHTEGTWDEEKKTLTMVGDAPGPDGNTWTHILDTIHKDDKTKVLTMHMYPKDAEDQKMKLFEMTYTKKGAK